MRRVLVAAMMPLAMSGCSLVLVNKPPPGDGPVSRGDCTRSIVAPVADVVYGVVFPLGFLAMAADDADGIASDDLPGVAVLAVWAAGGTYSAVRGFGWTSDCKRRNALSEEALADYLRGSPSGAPPDGSLVPLDGL
ncbi:hypothetical protein [Candidatus Palauibacter sp.]|uniref:hypothetical protein n=1 Tax=Candidatus Palauibacter sp. TaxID=3101350 RepID=UPI003B01C72C